MRTNVYKNKVLEAFKGAHLLSIADIKYKIPKADFSTIFRNIEQLCIEGLIRRVTISKDVVLYEISEKNHRHDHFVCTDCGTIEAIHLPKKIISKRSIDEVLVRGVCEDCIT